MSVSINSYLTFCTRLREVAKQCQAPLKDEQVLAKCSDYTHCEVMEKLIPNLSVEAVVEKVDQFVRDNLVKYVASYSLKNPELSKAFLQNWVKRIEIELEYRFGPATDKTRAENAEEIYARHFSNTMTSNRLITPYNEAENKFKSVMSEFSWPSLTVSDAKILKKEVAEFNTDVFVEEILHRKYPGEEIPPFAFNRIGKDAQNARDLLIINKYSPLYTDVSLTHVPGLTDETMRKFFQRFANMKRLDISGCIKLTSACLIGNDSLEEVTIKQTALKPTDFTKTLFKSVKIINADKQLVVFDMRKHLDTLSFESIRQQIQSADECLWDQNTTYTLTQAFIHRPCKEGILALQAWVDYAKTKKTQQEAEIKPGSFSFAPPNRLHTVESDVYEVFIKEWRRCSSWSEDGLGPYLTTFLLNFNSRKGLRSIAEAKEDRVWTAIVDAINAELTQQQSTQSLAWGQPHVIYNTFTDNDMSRARAILVELSHRNWDLSDIRDRILKSISFFYDKISNISDTPSKIFKDSNLRSFEFLHELYVVISDLLRPNDKNNPFLKLKPEGTDMYKSALGFTLATGFVFRSQDRKQFYEYLLANFSNYTTTSELYPLAKLVLGVMTQNDMPDADKRSLLKGRILAYQGVFFEDFDVEFKKKVFEQLVAGKLGGYTPALVDGLAILYSRDIPEEGKLSIIQALEKMSLSDIPVKEYARDTLAALRGPEAESVD